MIPVGGELKLFLFCSFELRRLEAIDVLKKPALKTGLINLRKQYYTLPADFLSKRNRCVRRIGDLEKPIPMKLSWATALTAACCSRHRTKGESF